MLRNSNIFKEEGDSLKLNCSTHLNKRVYFFFIRYIFKFNDINHIIIIFTENANRQNIMLIMISQHYFVQNVH